jgi:RNA polymerase sigma-70 factor, ECF subfamily
MESLSEEVLLRRFREGDVVEREAAFEEIHRRLGRGLEIVCRRMLGNSADAEDALQEVFLALHRGLPQFRGEARLSTWVYRIAVRTALQHKLRSRRSSDEGLEQGLAREAGDAVHDSELARALDSAVAALRPASRAVFSLCCIDELSRKDVAGILGIPEGTVWTQLHRARKELAEKMKPWIDP